MDETETKPKPKLRRVLARLLGPARQRRANGPMAPTLADMNQQLEDHVTDMGFVSLVELRKLRSK